MGNRLYKFDNLKAVLIFLVVFGHFLELVQGHRLLYLTIYSFHMPLFIFITGYFAHFDSKKILSGLVFPYCVFQILYTYFERIVLENENLTLTFLRPRWILWYLFAMIVYYLLIPFFDVKSKKQRIAAVTGMVLLALLSGYDSKVGYDYSSARIFTFMPFFYAGYYLSDTGNMLFNTYRGHQKSYMLKGVVSAGAAALMVMVLSTDVISKKMLYGSYSYEDAGYNIWIKLLILVFASVWTAVFMLMAPDKKIPMLSEIGKDTMPVFLLHGFIVKLIDKQCRAMGESLPLAWAVVLSAAVVLVLGNRYVNAVFVLLFTGKNKKKVHHSDWSR